jgi:hypothetical protein
MATDGYIRPKSAESHAYRVYPSRRYTGYRSYPATQTHPGRFIELSMVPLQNMEPYCGGHDHKIDI